MTRLRCRFSLVALAATLVASAAAAQEVSPPSATDSVQFLAIGDTGTGGSAQQQVAAMIMKARAAFPFSFAIMMGDNLYGSERPQDYAKKFEIPYKPLLDAKVEFYASLGNHDDPNQRLYKPFNMNGERFYTFKKGNVRFFALDSNYFDRDQADWLEKALAASTEDWKICFFHHPLYSSGEKHGPSLELRKTLEPLFMKYGVDVVFTGHEHFYERIKPQHGIEYFILGNSAKLREDGVIAGSAITAKAFDTDNAFMTAEIGKDALTFQTISRNGAVIDSGKIVRSQSRME
jgi:predicted phosphodiesterase